MSLRVRLFLVLALVAVAPVGVAAWGVRTYLEDLTERERRREENDVARSLRRDIDVRLAALADRVRPVCDGHRMVDQVLQDLHEGTFDRRERDAVGAAVPGVLRDLEIDSLEIVGTDDRILVSSDPRRAGKREAGAFRQAGRAAHRLQNEVRRVGGRATAVVLSACIAEEYESTRVAVVAGRAVGVSFSGDTDPTRRARLVLEETAGAALSLQGHTRVPILESEPSGPAFVVVVKNTKLEETLDRMWLAGGLLAISVVLLAWLLAAAISGKITRPLSELVEGAKAVAAGEPDVRIDVRAGGEVGSLVRAFNQMIEDLAQTRQSLLRSERIAAWREIARRIAHEIKNPLSPIQTSIETLRKAKRQNLPLFDEIFEESATTILEEVERLKRIVTEFSQFARMPRPRPSDVDVADLLGHAVGLHAGGDVPVRLQPPEPLPPLRADREQLVQVLVNLVQNGIDACRAVAGAGVDVVARSDGAGLRIEVKDGGAGLSAEARERLFEPYFTTKTQGTGLGLAIAHRIVTDHSGRITVSSASGGGTTFIVWLPWSGPAPASESVA